MFAESSHKPGLSDMQYIKIFKSRIDYRLKWKCKSITITWIEGKNEIVRTLLSHPPLHFLLWPLSVFYSFFLVLKKLCYWLDILPSIKLPVPVIMIDSISIDDGGKTPLLLWLVDCLLAHGFSPGIITRGNYDNPGPPDAVTTNSDPHRVGGKHFYSCSIVENHVLSGLEMTEPKLQKDFWMHPTCNVIICNDGMQYYRLERDIDLVVVDFSEQSFGNGLLLPAGPLRMHLKYLGNSSIIVTNEKQNHHTNTSKWENLQYEADQWNCL